MNNSKTLSAQVIDFHAPLAPFLYWDANFIVNSIYPAGNWHAECAAFMTRLEESDTLSFVSTLALDEAWFTLLQLQIAADHPDRSFWRVVNSNPKIVAKYVNRLEQITNDIYNASKIRIVTVGTHTPRLALNNMRDFYLLPRDALHLATMRQYKLAHLITTDADFLPVRDLSIYTCNPTLLQSR